MWYAVAAFAGAMPPRLLDGDGCADPRDSTSGIGCSGLLAELSCDGTLLGFRRGPPDHP